MLILELPHPIHPKVNSIQAPSLLDVDAVDAVEGIDDGLSAIGEDGVAETLGDDLDGHAGFDADAVHALAILGSNLVEGHRL